MADRLAKEWFAQIWLLKGRLRFGDGKQWAPFPSALVLWGGDHVVAEQLRSVVPEAWHLIGDAVLGLVPDNTHSLPSRTETGG